MIKLKTKKMDDNAVIVKARYKGNLNELQVDLVSIIADFGTMLANNGIEEERIKVALDAILNIAKDKIQYKED